MYYFGGKQQRTGGEDIQRRRDVDYFANDLRAVEDYARRIHVPDVANQWQEEEEP